MGKLTPHEHYLWLQNLLRRQCEQLPPGITSIINETIDLQSYLYEASITLIALNKEQAYYAGKEETD